MVGCKASRGDAADDGDVECLWSVCTDRPLNTCSPLIHVQAKAEPSGSAESGGGRSWAQLLAEDGVSDAEEQNSRPTAAAAAANADTAAAPPVDSDGKASGKAAAAASKAAAVPPARCTTRQSAAALADAAAAHEGSRGAQGTDTVTESAVKAAAEAGDKPSAADCEDEQQHGSLEAAARAAIAAQPTGFTLSTTNVQTKVSFLLRCSCDSEPV